MKFLLLLILAAACGNTRVDQVCRKAIVCGAISEQKVAVCEACVAKKLDGLKQQDLDFVLAMSCSTFNALARQVCGDRR